MILYLYGFTKYAFLLTKLKEGEKKEANIFGNGRMMELNQWRQT